MNRSTLEHRTFASALVVSVRTFEEAARVSAGVHVIADRLVVRRLTRERIQAVVDCGVDFKIFLLITIFYV